MTSNSDALLTTLESPPKGLLLLADDDPVVQDAVAKLLERQGYRCLLASNAASATQILQAEDLDALISDIDMPGNSDLQFIASIPAIKPGLPVFLLTGQPEFATAVKSVRLAVVAYLVKPLDMSELLAPLSESVLRYRRAKAVAASRARAELWARELSSLEEDLRHPATANRASSNFLTRSIQNMAVQLGELARSMSAMSDMDARSSDVEKAELISAMRQTIAVLEHTRKNFKSKELGELRRLLSDLVLEKTGEKPASPPRAVLEGP